MAAQSLTEKSILAIKPAPKQRLEVYDTKTAGLGIRVSASANGRLTRTWVLLFRVGRRLRRMTLGRCDELSLDEARSEAAEARLKARKGFDPAEERRQRQREQERAQSETFRAVSERFLRQYVRRDKKLRSADEYERIIDFDLLPAWGDRPIGSLSRRDVIDVIEAVKDRGAPTMANRVLAVARKLFNWAVSQDLIAHSPCVGVRTDVPETKRDHFLKDDEIRALWPEAEAHGYPFGPLIQLLLLTGQRLSEVAGMRWSELDLDKAEWHIPPERMKAKRALLVPLSRPALATIKSLPKIDRRGFVFSTTGKSAVSGFSKVKRHLHDQMLKALKKQTKENGQHPARVKLQHWTLHDLRRTAKTLMARAGVRPDISERVLGHVIPGVEGVYDQHSYLPEKRQALDALARLLDRIITGKATNIVSLKARSGPAGHTQ